MSKEQARNPQSYENEELLLAMLPDLLAQMGFAGVTTVRTGAMKFVDARASGGSRMPLQAAACTDRIAFGPRAGQKVLTVQGAMPRDKDLKQTLCADIDGFSLPATVRCGADDRQALEQLCRYITRPALANERGSSR